MASKKLTVSSIVPVERIEGSIFLIRGQKVMLDIDLADLFGVPTGRFNEAVTRNLKRFPDDFMFRLTKKEWEILKSQIAISSSWGGRRSLPRAFTEQGVAMLSGVLKSDRAVAANIEIMRAFVRLRQMLASNEELARKLAALERKYDKRFKLVFDALRELMTPPEKERKPVGFQPRKSKRKKS